MVCWSMAIIIIMVMNHQPRLRLYNIIGRLKYLVMIMAAITTVGTLNAECCSNDGLVEASKG